LGCRFWGSGLFVLNLTPLWALSKLPLWGSSAFQKWLPFYWSPSLHPL
jgi:hypothetical protein